MRILPDIKFNLIIFAVALGNFALMFLFEVRLLIFVTLKKTSLIRLKEFIIENNWRNTLNNSPSAVQHRKIEKLLGDMPDWPPIFPTATTTKSEHHEVS